MTRCRSVLMPIAIVSVLSAIAGCSMSHMFETAQSDHSKPCNCCDAIKDGSFEGFASQTPLIRDNIWQTDWTPMLSGLLFPNSTPNGLGPRIVAGGGATQCYPPPDGANLVAFNYIDQSSNPSNYGSVSISQNVGTLDVGTYDLSFYQSSFVPNFVGGDISQRKGNVTVQVNATFGPSMTIYTQPFCLLKNTNWTRQVVHFQVTQKTAYSVYFIAMNSGDYANLDKIVFCKNAH